MRFYSKEDLIKQIREVTISHAAVDEDDLEFLNTISFVCFGEEYTNDINGQCTYTYRCNVSITKDSFIKVCFVSEIDDEVLSAEEMIRDINLFDTSNGKNTIRVEYRKISEFR